MQACSFHRILTAIFIFAFTVSVVFGFDGFITMEDGYFYDSGSGEPWVPHGIAYQTWNRPLGVWQTKEQIDYDLDEMVKMGANSVRIDIVWQHAEEKGDNQFSWENYDYFMDACEERGLRIFALIGYQWPPNWFPDEWYTMHPPAVDAEGIEHTNRWQSDIINYEHPDARAQYAEWIGAVCSRYKNEKAVVGWIVGNESGYLGLWSGLLDGYDPETEQAFRDWTSNKYSTITAANTAWGTDYEDFDDITFVEQYRAYGPEGAQWADMVQFREDSIASFTAVGAVAAKQADTNHLVSYSTVGMQWGEEDWRYHAEDRGKITTVCAASNAPIDFFSVNNYPWSVLGHESQQGHWGISYTKKVAGVPVVYSETGFTSSETMWPGMDEDRQGPLVRNSLWESLEAGAIGTHIFSWMDRPYITDREKGFGIVYADRRIKPAFWVSRDTFTLMKQVEINELLRGSEDPTPDIAFLWTAAVDSQYNRYECEMQQIAGALERLGYEPNFMDLQELADGAYTNYGVVILPRNMRVEETVPGYTNSILNFLENYVLAAGVHVMASADVPGLQNAVAAERESFEAEVDSLFGIDASNIGGEEAPQRANEYVSWYWKPLDITFTSNAVGRVSTNYTYTCQTWKYNDEIEVSDGSLWATMDARRNKGFEDSSSTVTNWGGTWGNVYVRSGWGWAYEGNNMVQMWGESGMFDDFEVLPFGRYSHGAFLRSNNSDPLRGGAYAETTLEWYDEDANLLGVSHSVPLAEQTPDDGWVEYLVDATAPAESWTARRITRINKASTNLLSNGTLDGSGNAPTSWSDWNSSNHDADTNTARTGDNSWAFWYDGGIFQDISSGFRPGDTLRVSGYLYTPAGGGSSASITNGGFEEDSHGTQPPSSWTKTGNGATWVQTIAFAAEGSNTLKIYQGWANQATLVYQDMSTSQGDTWVATAKFYDWSSSGNVLTSGDEAYVTLEWIDSNGSNVGTTATSAKVTSSSGQDTWHTVSVTGTAPANAVSARISPTLKAGPNNNVVIFVDETSLTKQGAAGDSLRDGTKYGVIDVEFYDGDTKVSSASAWPTITADSDKGEWIYSEVEATVPAGADKARVLVRCNDYTSGDGRFMADDIMAVNESHFANLLANAGMDGTGSAPTDWSQWNDGSHDAEDAAGRSDSSSWVFWWDGGIYQDVTNGFVGGDKLQFGAYLMTPDPDDAESSLLHGGFEGDAHGDSTPTDWTKEGNGAVWVQRISFADEGTNTLKIYQGWNSQATRVYQDVDAAEGDEWVATAKFYDWSSSGNVLASGDEAYVTLEWLDSNGSNVGTTATSAKVTYTDGQDSWHSVSVTGTAPANAVSARISPTLKAGPNNNVVIFVDSVSLTKETGLSSDPLRNGTKYGLVQLELYDGATKLSTVSASPTINSNSVAQQWLRAEGTVTTPTNADSARLVIRCNDYNSGDGRFLADDAFVRGQTPGGSVYVDDDSESPAVVVKDHGTAKAAIFLYAAGDNNPDGNEDGEMDVLPWQYRYDIFGAVVQDYFGVDPTFSVSGSNAYLCLPEYRTCTNGSVLLQVKNYFYAPGTTNGGPGETFTITSDLFSGKTVEAFLKGEVLEQNSDGTIELTLEPDGMDMLLVYETGKVNQVVHIKDTPAVVHPFGSYAYEATVKYDCLDRSDLTLCLAFQEDGDNGDGTANEIYQQVTQAVSGSGEYKFYIWIPDPDPEDSDYLSTPDGGEYVFSAWLQDSSSNAVAQSIPHPVQLKWGVRPTADVPESLDKGDTVNMEVEWEELYEYLEWENTPIARNEAFPDRVAIFRSSKTEDTYAGHFDTVNAVCDWLESMGYESGNKLDITFDNVVVSNQFSDNFNDGNMNGWTRAAGCGNWDVVDNGVRATRIGNDDNIIVGGSVWSDYSAEVDIKYNEQGPYFNDAELFVRYQDRDNFVKVGIRNFYGFWRLKYTVRVATNNLSQGWLHDFPKTNAPTTNVTYNLRVEAQGDTYTVFFDGQQIGSFVDTNFASGKIALGTKAVQLGIWDPAEGYYFVDDDEYSYYSANEQETVTLGYPLDLDYGYLNTFYPTLILPGTYVMSDTEVSNVITWATAGMHSLIAIDGGVARKDAAGTDDLGRIEELFGASASLNEMTNLSQVTVGAEDHYVTLDYDESDTISMGSDGTPWTTLDGGTKLADVDNGVDSAPAFLCNTVGDDPEAPNKVFCFNFDAAAGGQLTNELATVAQRAFEWVRGEALKVTLELKYDTATTNAQDFVVYETTGWILSGSGTNTLIVDIPERNIMTGDSMYWVLYVHPWDSDDPYGEHAGFYSSENDGANGVFASISGIGLQILGITDTAYAGRDWDKWIAYNTRTQDLVLAYGIKDVGLIEESDNFDDGNYTGWTVDPDANVSWSVATSRLQAAVSGTADSLIELDGVTLNNTNVTIEYDVLFSSGTDSGGIVYRGVELEVNPNRYGWVDSDAAYYTNSPLAEGEWQHVVVTIRDGNPYMRCDLRVGTNYIFVSEDIEVTNFTADTVGFVAAKSSGYTAWDNFRLVDEEYAVVWQTVNGISYPTNAVPTGTWPSVPDYDNDMIEHGGYNEGSEYEWFINFRGQENVYARQDVDIFFAPRLMVEATNFPTSMSRGDTVNVPIEWEGIGLESTAKLWLSLEDPYLGTNAARAVFDITNETGSANFQVTIDSDATSSPNYTWLAYFYPPSATNPMLQRIGLDDTFRFQPVPEGAPIEPEVEVEIDALQDGDYMVYTDNGIPAGSTIYTWSGGSAMFDAEYSLFPAPEGVETFYTLSFIDYAGWGVFDTSGVDMSSYSNGHVRFSLFSQETLKVEIEDMDGNKDSFNVYSTGAAWRDLAIPLTNCPSVDLSDMKGYFMITSYDGALYLVDQVRWTED
jgi:hypothetical protein